MMTEQERLAVKAMKEALESALSLGEIQFGTCVLSRTVKRRIEHALELYRLLPEIRTQSKPPMYG